MKSFFFFLLFSRWLQKRNKLFYLNLFDLSLPFHFTLS